MNGVKVGHIQTPTVGGRAVARILLDVKPKEANIGPVLFLKGKDSSRSEGEVVLHQTIVHKLLLHFRFHLHLLLSDKDDPYVDFLHRAAVLSLQEVLHSNLDEIAQPRRRKVFGREPVPWFGIGTVGAAELGAGYVLKVESAHLVQLPATVFALHHLLLLHPVVRRIVELLFLDLPGSKQSSSKGNHFIKKPITHI